MHANDALAFLELELGPLATVLFAVELDLSALIGVKGDVLNLHVARVVAHANTGDILITRHL